MSSIAIASIAFACIYGGALTGLFMQRFLPDHHLRSESKDAIKLGAGLIATMAALVLGLLVGSAKSSFDAVNAGLTEGGARVIMLDRILAHYGPETKDVRDELRRTITNSVALLWPEENAAGTGFKAVEGNNGTERVAEKLHRLSPQTESQRSIQSQALQMSNDLLQSRWLLIEQEYNSLPTPFLVILIFWLTILNLTYGLLAPRNLTVIAVMLVCALSLSGAIFLILEMNSPLEGMIKASSAPLRNALEHLGK
jgi:hypothetical protein